MNRFLVLFALALIVTGCGFRARALPEATEVRGKVAFADGSPIRNVTLAVQPIGEGHPETFQVGADGNFTGKLITGKYVYFVEPAKSRNATPTDFSRVPAKYQTANMEHQTTFGGSSVEIRLSN